jgi:predicted  nucleic acid-binding Zn-ribbon protein
MDIPFSQARFDAAARSLAFAVLDLAQHNQSDELDDLRQELKQMASELANLTAAIDDLKASAEGVIAKLAAERAQASADAEHFAGAHSSAAEAIATIAASLKAATV